MGGHGRPPTTGSPLERRDESAPPCAHRDDGHYLSVMAAERYRARRESRTRLVRRFRQLAGLFRPAWRTSLRQLFARDLPSRGTSAKSRRVRGRSAASRSTLSSATSRPLTEAIRSEASSYLLRPLPRSSRRRAGRRLVRLLRVGQWCSSLTRRRDPRVPAGQAGRAFGPDVTHRLPVDERQAFCAARAPDSCSTRVTRASLLKSAFEEGTRYCRREKRADDDKSPLEGRPHVSEQEHRRQEHRLVTVET